MLASRSWGLGSGQSDKQRAYFEGQLGVLAKSLQEYGGPYLTGPNITLVRGLVPWQASISAPVLSPSHDRLWLHEALTSRAFRKPSAESCSQHDSVFYSEVEVQCRKDGCEAASTGVMPVALCFSNFCVQSPPSK